MKHKIAGISYQTENLLQIAEENGHYDLSNRDLIDLYSEGDKIYKYDFDHISEATLVPEPDNKADENAIAVYALTPAGPVKIGYVKAGSVKRLKTDRPYKLEIGGGPYKEIQSEEMESGRERLYVEKSETIFWGRFWLPEEESLLEADPPKEKDFPADDTYEPSKPVSEEPKKKSKTVLLLFWFFLGLFGGHKFYEGKTGLGFLYLFTAGLFVVGWIIDFFKILKYPSRF